jgi:hypothetical protein
MKFLPALLLMSLTGFAQPEPQRVHFKLKNNLGYHRMFRVEGPGIAYGFTMNRAETVENNWPIGAKLHYSTDGETTTGHILTVDEALAGRVVLVHDFANKKPDSNREVAVRFRNNSLWFRKVAIITYRPGETGNGTDVIWVVPFAVVRRQFPVGTRVYLADDAEVQTVMSGKRLTGTPFLTVAAADAGQTFPIFE